MAAGRQAWAPQRVKPYLRVDAQKPGHIPVQAQINTLSHDGASLIFDPVATPDFAIGELVDLRMSAPQLPDPIVVGTRVHFRKEMETGRVYGFEFVDWLGFLEQIPPALRALFNQRNSYRVKADLTDEILVDLTAPLAGVETCCPLRDLSAGGLSVWAMSGLEQSLRSVERVVVSFALPGVDPAMTFAGAIRYRQLDAEGLWYGIAFDPERTHEFGPQLERVIDYVAGRLKERFGRLVD